jgi:precorrin isomerase
MLHQLLQCLLQQKPLCTNVQQMKRQMQVVMDIHMVQVGTATELEKWQDK